MVLRPVLSTLRLPRTGTGPVSGGTFDAAMLQLEAALAPVVKTGTTAHLSGVILTASDGSSWQLTVSPAGALSTAPVLRS